MAHTGETIPGSGETRTVLESLLEEGLFAEVYKGRFMSNEKTYGHLAVKLEKDTPGERTGAEKEAALMGSKCDLRLSCDECSFSAAEWFKRPEDGRCWRCRSEAAQKAAGMDATLGAQPFPFCPHASRRF
jgi:hypothetical protein